jgi:hypothetical protein
VVKVDLRVVCFALDTQETVTRDGVAVRVNAVLWYRAIGAGDHDGGQLGAVIGPPKRVCAMPSANPTLTRC